jgi:hypothetical protein
MADHVKKIGQKSLET